MATSQEKEWNPFPGPEATPRAERRVRDTSAHEQVGVPKFERRSLPGMIGASEHVQERERWDPNALKNQQMLDAARITSQFVEDMRSHAVQPHMLAEDLSPNTVVRADFHHPDDGEVDYAQAA